MTEPTALSSTYRRIKSCFLPFVSIISNIIYRPYFYIRWPRMPTWRKTPTQIQTCLYSFYNFYIARPGFDIWSYNVRFSCASWFLGARCTINGQHLVIALAAILGTIVVVALLCCPCCMKHLCDKRRKRWVTHRPQGRIQEFFEGWG